MSEKKETDMKIGLARIKPFNRGLLNGLILAIVYYEFIASSCG